MKRIILFFIFFPLIAFSQEFSDYLPTSTTNQIVTHAYYTLSYSEEYEQAEWVAYELTKEKLSATPVGRTNDFREDRKVTTGSAALGDYRQSGYDRGHLVPAGDMSFSSTAMSESFYMSNMSPQHPSFNRGIWKKLESQVRNWAFDANNSIYVFTGPILQSCSESIGENNVCVPDYYYKFIWKPVEIKMIAFVLPNHKGEKELAYYVTSVDYVESITGIDFFPFTVGPLAV